MADESKPRTRFEMIMAYLRSLRDSEEEEPKKKKSGKPSIAELINFGGDYEERSEGGVLVGKDTGKTVKQTGRTVYKTDEGDNVSELSTTFEYKGKWINIPSVIMGEELTDDQLRELLDEGLIEPTSIHDDKDDAIKAAQERSDSLEFNKGGTPMDEQMKMFGEGGLLDEGGEVDEESGNEVPIGGTKEGVRDDIPAMLSEGEFVFPEDVTRYHGLEKLMNLRQEAKMGLKKMEAMGQMGNSEEATIPDDLPFTMDDLILVMSEEEPKKKDDEPIKAQAGTFVPAQQNLANVGIMGTQQSIYQQPNTVQPAAPLTVPASSLVPANTAPVGGYTAPTVLAAPATGYSPLYATEPVPTVATEVDEPEFVPDVSSEYKPVKYINPTTGDTMMINEYQGNPVSAVPAGYIRYDDYIAQGGTDTETTDTTGVESTSVETARVSGAQDDERKAKISNLDRMKEDRERKRIQEYNKVFDTESKEFKDKNDPNYITDAQLIDAYKDQMEAETIGMGLGLFAGPLGLLPRLGRGKVNKAMTARFGENFKELPEFKDITRGSVLKEAGSEIVQGFKDAFAPDFYDKYEAKYNVNDYDKNRMGTGYNLTAREQQAFDNAVDRNDDAIANHFSLIAQSRAAKDSFAMANADLIKAAQNAKTEEELNNIKGQLKMKNTGSVRLGDSSIDEIIKYGSSSTTAIKMGKAEQGKGLFGKATPIDPTPITSTTTEVKPTTQDDDPPPVVRPKSKPKTEPSSGAGDEAAAQKAIADAAAAKKAKEEADRKAREDRRKNDRSPSFTAPKPTYTKPSSDPYAEKGRPTSTKKTVSKRGGTRRGGGGGRATGGLMGKET